MGVLFGNSDQINKFSSDFKEGSNFLISGPPHVGKSHFMSDFFSDFPPEDILKFDGSKDSIPEIVEFNNSYPRFSEHRVLLIKNPEDLLENVQDSLLKIIEESSLFLKIVVISDNPELMNPTVFSRFRRIYRFSRLSDMDMAAFANSFNTISGSFLSISRGLPGIYHMFLDSPGGSEFISFLRSLFDGSPISPSILHSIPIIISTICKKREYISLVRESIIYMVSKFPYSISCIPLLTFVSNVDKCKSSDIIIHWTSSMIKIFGMSQNKK
jgi:hypothetical protein